jgi:type IV secretory pathway VirB2 component (pilin)
MPIIDILEKIADNELLVLGSFAVVAIIAYSIVAMTGRKGQATFKEGIFWVVVGLLMGLIAGDVSAWVVAWYR